MGGLKRELSRLNTSLYVGGPVSFSSTIGDNPKKQRYIFIRGCLWLQTSSSQGLLPVLSEGHAVPRMELRPPAYEAYTQPILNLM